MAKSLFTTPVHPGLVLKDQMEAVGLSANALGLALGVPAGRIGQIIKGNRSITADTAIRLGEYFTLTAETWMRLQANYDLAALEEEQGEAIRKQVRIPA